MPIIEAVLEQDSDSTWHYVHVPKEIRDEYKAFEHRGIIPVTVTLGTTIWQTSMLPWADGSAQISVNKAVREKENIKAGQRIRVVIDARKSI